MNETNIYPVYRKYSNGSEFMKVLSDAHMLSVFKTHYGVKIVDTSNKITISDALESDASMPSTKEEFESNYLTAISKISMSAIDN